MRVLLLLSKGLFLRSAQITSNDYFITKYVDNDVSV